MRHPAHEHGTYSKRHQSIRRREVPEVFGRFLAASCRRDQATTAGTAEPTHSIDRPTGGRGRHRPRRDGDGWVVWAEEEVDTMEVW